MRLVWGAAVIVGAALAVRGSAGAADPVGGPRARESVALCLQADEAPEKEEQRRLLARSLALAEEAIAADERDPVAHFAVFCAVGKQTRLAGVGIRSLAAIGRLRRAIDRALALEPEYLDGLAAKGSFLMSLPRFLGGSCAEGERLLRRALDLDPGFLGASLELARGLESCGQRGPAREAAETALDIAEREADAKRANEARALLAELTK
jgi:hypothetical protein